MRLAQLGLGFDDGSHQKPDDAADDRSDDRDEYELAADPAAALPEREKSRRYEERFEKCRHDRRKDARYDADQYVVRSSHHYARLRVGTEVVLLERHTAPDRATFAQTANDFAKTLRRGDVVALEGDLGAGKTTFVAHVTRALGSDADVASPTFTFWHRYAGPVPIEHLDLYRIERPSEAVELGLDDALDPAGIALVEWPDRLPGFVPHRAIRVRIVGVGEGPRTLEFERPGA